MPAADRANGSSKRFRAALILRRQRLVFRNADSIVIGLGQPIAFESFAPIACLLQQRGISTARSLCARVVTQNPEKAGREERGKLEARSCISVLAALVDEVDTAG